MMECLFVWMFFMGYGIVNKLSFRRMEGIKVESTFTFPLLSGGGG